MFIVELFLCVFIGTALFLGLGLTTLAWFNLAPMPKWMKKYKRNNV